MRLGLRYELIGDTFTTATAKTRYEADKKMLNPDLNASDNRMAAGQGWSYDPAGNVIADPQGRAFIFDAENRARSRTRSNRALASTGTAFKNPTWVLSPY